MEEDVFDAIIDLFLFETLHFVFVLFFSGYRAVIWFRMNEHDIYYNLKLT